MRRLKNQLFKKLAVGYIVGSSVNDAQQACLSAREQGWAATICPWNSSGAEPGQVAAAYLEALQAISELNLDVYLSIKVPALGYDFERVKDILLEAKKSHIRIHFDAQNPASAAPTFAILEKSLSLYTNLGCTLPSRWQRSEADAERVIEYRIPVRIVKGQWEDPDAPKLDPAAGYRKLVTQLSGRAKLVAVASHDFKLVKSSLRRLRETQTPCELELLYGLPMKPISIAREESAPVRIYVPYGHACLPYGLSMMIKRPVIAWWMIRDIYLGNRLRLP